MNAVYTIINLINNKRYIGQSTNISSRWIKHKYMLNSNKHPSIHLQNAWNKYGKEIFEFKILEDNILTKNLIDREKFYINLFKSNDRKFGYNIRVVSGSNAGIKYSPEIVEKNRLAHLGIKHTDETKLKMSKIAKGKPSRLKGRKIGPMPQEQKIKIRESVLKAVKEGHVKGINKK